MRVKSFILRKDNIDTIINQCTGDTIAIVRPEKSLEILFSSFIERVVVEKKSADDELNAINEYLESLSQNDKYIQIKSKFIEYVTDYLIQSVTYSASINSIKDYILAQCVNLYGQLIAFSTGIKFIDGREMIICNPEGNVNAFDWKATLEKIKNKCENKSHLLISGGYARTHKGNVISIGRDGANLMASLVGAAINAEAIEFYVESDIIYNIPSMTYEEAAHYCASSVAPFPSTVLWPAKNANIPIYIKSAVNHNHIGTKISTDIMNSDIHHNISGIVVDRELDLITIYGTGLLGQIGASSSIFSAISQAGINIRFIAQTSSEYAISFAVNVKDNIRITNVLSELISHNPLISVDETMVINREVAAITIYGSRMKNIPGISGKVFSLLGEAGINVIASAQGGEELSISIVVDINDVDAAQAALGILC